MHERLSLSLLWGLCALALSAMGCSDSSARVGLGPLLTFEPPMLAFGNVQMGTEASQVVLLRNNSDEPLVVEVALRDDSPDKSFRVESDRATISPQGTAELTVYFAPTGSEPVTGELVVRPDNPQLAVSVLAMSGSGVRTTIVVDPHSLSFGNVNVAFDSTKTLPITVSNISNVDASIEFTDGRNARPCAAGGDQSTAFCMHTPPGSMQPDGRFSLRAGESTSLDIDFSPTLNGARERGTFTLRACDNPACETEIHLDGLGIEQGLRCTPPVLDFAQVNPGACLAETVSCENIAHAPITVVGWGPSSNTGQATSPDFSFEPSRVVVLNAGESVDVQVTYCPGDLGNDAGYLQIETGRPAPNRFVHVGLNGTGGGPDIEVLPERLVFGLVSVIAPTRRNVLVTNVGLDDLEISSITADTAGTGAFSTPSAGATVIPPGGSHVITVEFQPVAQGPIESSLLIASNDRDEPELQVRLLGEGLILPACDFEVSPLPLNFGVVQVQRFQGRAVQIRNVGRNDCLVTSARLEPGTDPEFSLPEGDMRTQIIAPADALTVGVDYAPLAAGTHAGALEFSISSPTSPFNRVPLVGTAAQATLLIAPNEIDFGTVDLSCATARAVRIYNPSSRPALINDIRLSGTSSAAFTLTAQPAPLPAAPVSILPGQFIEFAVSFEGGPASRYAAAVEISAVFEGSPTTSLVSLRGETSIAGVQADRFEQLSTAKVDLLFVIDFTSSMGQEQAALADNFAAFVQFAQAQTLDYQIGITTTGTDEEAGRLIHADQMRGAPFAGPIAHRLVGPNTSPDPQTVFAKNVQGRPLTRGGARDEAGLYASYLALTPPVITGHNAGFVRPDALLSVIYVSDEPEQSHTSIGAPASSVDFYVDFLRSVKGFRDESLFSASAIVGDAPRGCNGAGGAAAPGPRYIELAHRTGGTFQSICAGDWSRALEDLATSAFGLRSDFSLTSQPVVSTIEVTVDGSMVPAVLTSGTINWRYDFASNAVQFSAFAAPQPGAQILVRYTADCR